MARILFISDNLVDESLGIMSLSSYLKVGGHDVRLCLLAEFKKIDRLLKFIKDTAPDLIGFSVMTAQVNVFRAVTRIIKENTHHKIIWGGPHCMFMPDEVLKNECVDIICIGEGEEALLALMNRLDKRQDYNDIPGLWLKNNKEWIKNNIGPLEDNLDKYPFADRDLYYSKYPLLGNFAIKRLITQRGCPYECSYCFEPSLKDLYRGKGKLVRRHSVDYVINEIKEVINEYPTRILHFSDDTFNLNKDWVMDFLSKYKQNIKLPFTCNILVSIIDEELIKEFKDAGCAGVVFGLECGIENTRMWILNKKVTDRKYIEVSILLRKYKIKFITNIMFCLPKETLGDAIKSIRFNKSLRPYGTKVGILKIYKGTRLSKFTLANNLSESLGEFIYKVKDIDNTHSAIKNMIWAGYIFVKFPFVIHFAKIILVSPISKFFKPLALLSNWQDIRFFRIPLWQAWRYFLHSRDVFVGGMGKEQLDTYKN